MKTSKILLGLALLGVLVSPVIILAANGDTPGGVTIGSFDDLIEKVGGILWKVVGLVALVMFVIAGLKFMFAQGKAEDVALARQFVLWGVVGIVVAILAYSIVAIVQSFFG